MSDDEPIEEFTRVRRRSDGMAVQVCRITWPEPHTPRSRWHTVAVLPADVRAEDIDAARRGLLDDRRHFRVFTECGERNPVGWMHGETICQTCAERNHGVVY